MQTPSSTDLLLPRVADGDKNAVRACIERYAALVWSLACRGNLGPTDAEDMVQEVFLELWRHAPRFDPQTCSEVTFVAMIARRRFVERRLHRTRRPQADRPRDPIGAPPPSALELGPDARTAAATLGRLPPEPRHVLVLTAAQGLSHEEVAHTTGIPLATVRAHARRGLLAVRDDLSQRGRSDEGPMGPRR